MYLFLSKLVKLLIILLRFVEVVFLLYIFLYIFFWFCSVARLNIAFTLAPVFKIPYDITLDIIKSVGLVIDKRLELLQPEIFISVVLTFISLILYNFIFIPIGAIEKFFVERGYLKGEHDYDI